MALLGFVDLGFLAGIGMFGAPAIQIEKMEDSRPIQRISLWNIFGLMTGTAAILGLGRILGPSLSFSFFLAAYAFAPAIALGLMWIFRHHSRRLQMVVGALTLVAFAASMMLICGYFYGLEAMPFVLVGTIIEWPGQLGVLLCLRQIRQAQLASPSE